MNYKLLFITSLLLIVGCELKNGTYSDFYSNGQKSFEKNFSNGVEDGKWTHWYEDGVLKIKGNYKDGHEDGKWVYFYSNGGKKLEFNFKNKKIHGTLIKWYKDGNKEEEGTYNKGTRDGLWTYWKKDGTMTQLVQPIPDIVYLDWCYPSCDDNVQSSFMFSLDGTFTFSTKSFGGMSRWGDWEKIDDNTFRLTTTKISTNNSNDKLPKPQIIKIISESKIQVGSSIYLGLKRQTSITNKEKR